MEDPGKFFQPGSAPSFVAGLSIGYAKQNNIQYSRTQQNITIISYYDKITDFNFDEAKETFFWSMPFDWDSGKIANKTLLVHHEIKIPKSMIPMDNLTGIQGSLNDGTVLAGRSLAIDPFSSEEYLTVHYILSKTDILAMSHQIDPLTTKEMKFRLYMGNPGGGHEEVLKTGTVLITDRSGIKATIDWGQTVLEAGKPSTMTVQFGDVLSEAPLVADVSYDLKIMDLNGTQILDRSNLIAKSGTDSQELVFPSDEKYYVEVDVNGFIIHSSNSNDQSSQTLDTTRAGVARGTVVVPEFPYQSVVLMMGALLGLLIAFNRKLFKNDWSIERL
jgi:hypothetical protein